MDYEIIDNFLPKSNFKLIKSAISDPEFPWLYKEMKGDAQSTVKNYAEFEHLIYTQNVPVSPFFETFSILVDKLECRSLLNMSCLMYMRENELFTVSSNPNYAFPNTKAIFYLNNNDGYTLLEEDIKIENIENRLIIFDGSKPYIESNCTNTMRRLSISFNYI